MSCPFRKLVTALRGRYIKASSISREGLNLAPFSIGLDLKRNHASPGREERPLTVIVYGRGGFWSDRESSRTAPSGEVELPSNSVRHHPYGYRLPERWRT